MYLSKWPIPIRIPHTHQCNGFIVNDMRILFFFISVTNVLTHFARFRYLLFAQPMGFSILKGIGSGLWLLLGVFLFAGVGSYDGGGNVLCFH